MAFNANFTEVRIAKDGGLVVQGTSVPNDGATKIRVTLAHGDNLLSELVDDPTQETWSATFKPDTPRFEVHSDVYVSGMALRPGNHDPLVWQGGFTIKSLDEK
jgi:hypothetical protein